MRRRRNGNVISTREIVAVGYDVTGDLTLEGDRDDVESVWSEGELVLDFPYTISNGDGTYRTVRGRLKVKRS